MYKLILLDLDGTLLTSKKEISDYTCNYLKSIKDKVKIVLASARGFSRIKQYVQILDLVDSNNYTIAFNGSLVLDNLENKLVDNSIDKTNVKLLQSYINKNNFAKWYYYTYEDSFNIENIDNIKEFIDKQIIYKIVCVAEENYINELRENMPIEVLELFQITSSEPTRIEFVKKGMTKLDAIKLLISKLDIDSKEVIAIGDGENDIDMIKFAGCGVAMENATQKVKDIANLITDSNDNDGVAKILEQLL